nr:hypothetical protein [Tanacetum cinerariifolium]
MNGWVDDNDDVKEEDDENGDVDIEDDDDAKIIVPYEVQGDQTPPPRDESFDSEFEAEEADDELGGSGGAVGSGGTGGNADGTGVKGAGLTVPELTGCTYATFIKCDPLPFNGTEGAVG